MKQIMHSLFVTVHVTFVLLALAANPQATVADDCATLSSLLPGHVYAPGLEQYNESISSYFYVQERLAPACVIAPTSAENVSAIIKLLKASGSPFAIRGGGHGSVSGSANVQDGVTVDMGNIDAISLSPDLKIASVGAGATWDQVYNVLDKQALSVLGGRSAHVGVGGLLLGGGISFFSPQRGFACDGISNIELVLADGTITTANTTFNSDLFTALKGGTNNFGIVTRYDLNTFSQGLFYGGALTFYENTTTQQIDAFNAFKKPESFDPLAELELSLVYLGAEQTFLGSSSLFYSKPDANASALASFASIKPLLSNSLRISNASDFAGEIFTFSTLNQYSVWATTTFVHTPTILSRIYPLWRSSALSMNNITNVTSSMTLQSIPPPAPATLPNSLGFAPDSHPQKDFVLLLISIFFEDGDATDELDDATKEFISNVDEVAEDEGVDVDYTYLNYAAAWQDPLRDYGDESYERMREVADKYDPEGVFQSQTGGFKLYR